jgi:hypothetical protein
VRDFGVQAREIEAIGYVIFVNFTKEVMTLYAKEPLHPISRNIALGSATFTEILNFYNLRIRDI